MGKHINNILKLPVHVLTGCACFDQMTVRMFLKEQMSDFATIVWVTRICEN